jgi:hypothetical protein
MDKKDQIHPKKETMANMDNIRNKTDLSQPFPTASTSKCNSRVVALYAL